VAKLYKDFGEENGRTVYEGRKERREKLLSYHSPHTFFIMHAYVAFKPFFVSRI